MVQEPNKPKPIATKKEHTTHKPLDVLKEVRKTDNESPLTHNAKCGSCNEDGIGAPAGSMKAGNAAGHECSFEGGSKVTFGKSPHCGHDAEDTVYGPTKEKCPGPEEAVHSSPLGKPLDTEESVGPKESTRDNTLSE